MCRFFRVVEPSEARVIEDSCATILGRSWMRRAVREQSLKRGPLLDRRAAVAIIFKPRIHAMREPRCKSGDGRALIGESNVSSSAACLSVETRV